MKDNKPTEKEVQIVQMAANDTKQADIAISLDISVRSVESTIKKIKAEFGLKSLPALCIYFYKQGWIA